MVSPNNDDDLMSQVFASVQLPEVKWTTETHQSQEVIHKTVTVNENGEQHIHTEHYHYNQNGEGHESDDEHKSAEHSDNHGYHHGNSDEDMVSQVFFSRPTGDTFRVENGIPSSDGASERSSSRLSHHSHHSHHSHMSESEDHEHENGHLTKKILESVPHKTQQQDSLIAELKKQHSGLDDTSDDETLKGDDDDDHTVNGHDDMWHHEPQEEQIHVAHYDLPPQEPPRDYESDRHSVAAMENHHPEHDNYFGHNNFVHQNHDNRSQRSNSIQSEASRHSVHGPPSHHSSHHSLPAHTQQQPQTRDSRASSTSTLRSERDIRIVTNHAPPAPPQNPPPRFDHGYDSDENTRRADPKGIHTYREYGSRGHRHSDASERSSVGYHRESFTVGDIEYIQEKPRAPQRERTVTKQSTTSYSLPPQKDKRTRTDTRQTVISQRSVASHQNVPAKRTSLSKQVPMAPFVPNVDDSPIAPVSHLADHYGGRSQGNNRHLFFPKKPDPVVEHHSRASSKRGSDVSSVPSLKPFEKKTGRSDTHQSGLSHTSHHSNISHKRRESTDSVGTQHTGVIEKNPGKYDSIRVVKNVRSYKQFLDVWSQREIEEAAEEGPIHAEPIPRPRYSISARHVYPDIQTLKSQQPKHRPSLRPSEKLNEFSLPGKVDKATSYTNLSVIGTETRRSTFVPIQEEDEVNDVHHHMNGAHDSPQRSRKSTLKHVEHDEDNHHHQNHDNDDDYDVDIGQLRSVFEHGRQQSRRASMQSNVSSKSLGPIPIVPASHRHALDNGASYSRRRRR